jgi:hypothetical protein
MDSADVDEVLVELTRRRRWTAHFYGGRQTPHLIAFTFAWRGSGCADVVLLRGEHDAAAYRTPHDSADVLCPELVCWSYEGAALWTMRAMLTIPPPSHPHAPYRLYAAPASCQLPNSQVRPLVIRPTTMS